MASPRYENINSDVHPGSVPPKKKKKEDKKEGPLASLYEVFTAFGNTRKIHILRITAIFFAIISGLCFPALAYLFSNSFQDLGADPTSEKYMKNIREMVWIFIVVGVIGFVSISIQNILMEMTATESTLNLKKQWFNALLRQDMAYFDIKDVSSQATVVSTNAAKYKRGTGRKLAEGIQFTATAIGGLVYAFYESWRISLLILGVLPFMAISGFLIAQMVTKQSENEAKNYEETGGIVYTTISSIRTIYSLNAGDHMITKFEAATEKAKKSATKFLWLSGVFNGMLISSFMLAYIIVTLYGSYLLYDKVRKTGCDPSGTLENFGGMFDDVETCEVSSVHLFGALFGVLYSAIGLPQISAAMESLNGARAACHPALLAINRKVDKRDQMENYDDKISPTLLEVEDDVEKNMKTTAKREKIPLPKYVIDSLSTAGKKPSSVTGEVVFRDVCFAYPTRPDTFVFDGFNLTIEAGKTVALVGPSGGGKSTVISLLERFYDPITGSITLDGHDLCELNVRWLRDQIGLVAQEPSLFARSIRENIEYGCRGAGLEQIKEAAKLANAHDFISQFPDGYDTLVGDKGAQLSGGQKQRIAIARILLKNPKILLLDEATSALDNESEFLVQKAMDDHLLGSKDRTTIVIAHRLSTIRNADVIAVVKDGRIVESGTHDQLMSTSDSQYSKLVEAQKPPVPTPAGNDTSALSQSLTFGKNSDVNSDSIDNDGGNLDPPQLQFSDVHFAYPTRTDINIFKGLNLSVRKGETLAIAGPSGGGKSTIIQLIERFYDPCQGSVKLDGVDLKQMNVRSLRDELGLVSQEPILFNTTIGENIKYGYPEATQDKIEEAAKQANAHEFIMSFPHGYDTEVGENGTQVSGGQKQRIAIARAIIKKPNILLLDEATSALDSESEAIVQRTIDSLIAKGTQTVIVIAHRLSTIQNADRIAVVADGIVKEIGTHDQLIALPEGHYRRLNELRGVGTSMQQLQKSINQKMSIKESNDEEEDEVKNDIGEEVAAKNAKSARKLLAKGDFFYLSIGSIGAIMAGLFYPGWGLLFGYMVEYLFSPVFPCKELEIEKFGSCEKYWDTSANDLQTKSFNITYGWLTVMGCGWIGFIFLFYGFGVATERMNKRVRDSVFIALLKHDISYFDQTSIGNLATTIEEDAAMMHSFSGEPLRTFFLTSASVLVGLILSFFYMWPFALMALATLPFLAFGSMMQMKMMYGEDEGTIDREDTVGPGTIVVETLLNIRTVVSLTIENLRSEEYEKALEKEDATSFWRKAMKECLVALGFLFQQGAVGFLFWWGSWVMKEWPGAFSFRGFLVSMFALMFSMIGITAASMGAVDKAKATLAADRIFALIEREGVINAKSVTK